MSAAIAHQLRFHDGYVLLPRRLPMYLAKLAEEYLIGSCANVPSAGKMTHGDSSGPAGKGPRSAPKPKRLEHLRVGPRGYPIIATISQEPGDVDFGGLSEPRKLALATFDLCAVCALPFGEELRWQVSFDEAMAKATTLVSNEAPVHGICALYAAQVCPFVSSSYARRGDEIRKGARARPALAVLDL